MGKLKSFYGAYIDERRSCGKCLYHNLYLTPQMVDERKCRQKQCKDLKRREEHEYWHQLELKKQRKKANKKKKKQMLYEKYKI